MIFDIGTTKSIMGMEYLWQNSAKTAELNNDRRRRKKASSNSETGIRQTGKVIHIPVDILAEKKN